MAETHTAFIEAFRCALVEATGGCAIETAGDGSAWPCGNCVGALFDALLPSDAPEYAEHNAPVDRVNEVWRAVLQIREAAPHVSVSPSSDL